MFVNHMDVQGRVVWKIWVIQVNLDVKLTGTTKGFNLSTILNEHLHPISMQCLYTGYPHYTVISLFFM